ncbi:MAG: proteasome accessory factor PafA2 family protein [Candidatus Glassbacteria bacterium]
MPPTPPEGFILGLETEFAIACFEAEDSYRARSDAVRHMLTTIINKYPNLPDGRGAPGAYLSNGCNIYVDNGLHLEFSTAETANPYDAVACDKAGERILSEAARSLDDRRVHIFKNNIDYQVDTTYGCHENYLISKDLDLGVIQSELVPFLVTRQIYAGAGRISTSSRSRGFELSQRAAFIRYEMTEETTRNRGIVNTKNEDLTGERYQRLHLIIGDSLMSQLGTFLKIGTTALLLRLLDCGVSLGKSLTLAKPLKSLMEISRDPACKRRVALMDGRSLTAVEIQRHYLKEAEKFLNYKDAPPWAGDVIGKWRLVLDLIENDKSALTTMLDSYIKLSYYSRFLEKRGLAWEDLRLTQSAQKSRKRHDPQEIKKTIQQLMELDIRYHDIDQNCGLFYILDKAGLLRHHVVSKEAIARSITNAPGGTRASARGKTIASLAGNDLKGIASWNGIWVPEDRKYFCLNNPFAQDVDVCDTSKIPLSKTPSPAVMRFLSELGHRYL